jgi:pSer/pThr/pTyr-binding forkhead associated (FHA) protein
VVITLILLHPLKSISVQEWEFESNSIIKIGRAKDNNVILYSAVVSRHHIEIRPNGSDLILINKGANGTFINGQKIDKVVVKDGMVFRIAGSGPKMKIKLKDQDADTHISKVITEESNSPSIAEKNFSKQTVIFNKKSPKS